jgi:hypothetical protein
VSASDGAGSTGYQTSSAFSVDFPPVPDAPASISGPTNVSPGRYNVSWSSVATAKYYVLEQSADAATWVSLGSLSTTNMELGLAGGHSYEYRVAACNTAGCSEPVSSDSSVYINFQPESAPSPLVAALPAANNSSDEVGATAGSFRVDESGGATYNIPIVTAPASGGVAPQLSLNYSSQGGNGTLGLGWSVSGLSAITRCRKTYEQDGVNGAINLGATDRFCLDGQRLIAVDGIYGASGTEYRTEIDSQAKVTSYGGTLADGPAYFEVKRKDGTVTEYGNTASALIFSP